MANSAVAVTPGAGANIAVNAVGGLDMQVVKLDLGGDGASIPASSDGTNGMDVHVQKVEGVVVVNNPTAANLKVDASGATVPVSAASALPVSALVTAPAFVRLSDGTNPIATLPVSGTVTANQGTAAAAAGAWPVELSDGTSVAGLTNVGGAQALKVDVIQSVSSSVLADKAAFTEGTSKVQPLGCEFQDSPSNPSAGQVAVPRITQLRAVHINIRKNDGTELGIAATPLRTDPTGTTTQPVSGTVTATLSSTTNAGATANTQDYDTGAGTDTMTLFGMALPGNGGAVAGGTATNPVRTDPVGTTTQPVNVGSVGGNAVATVANGVQKVALSDSTGASITAVNPAPTTPMANPGSSRWRQHLLISGANSAVSVRATGTGKTVYVEGFILTVTTGDVFKLFDNTDSATTALVFETSPTGRLVVLYPQAQPLAAINNVLKFTSGSSFAGDLVAWGFEQ